MAGVKISYDIKGEKGSQECFTLEAVELLLKEIKTCEELTGKKAKMKLELCE
jgi:hypothetical protein